MLSGGKPGPHNSQGIGAGFVPDVLRADYINEVIAVPTDDSVAMARRLPREEGLLVGISAAAAVVGCLQIAQQLKKNERAVLVTILCDSGDKYLSERFWQEE